MPRSLADLGLVIMPTINNILIKTNETNLYENLSIYVAFFRMIKTQ